jgi:Fic family protein
LNQDVIGQRKSAITLHGVGQIFMSGLFDIDNLARRLRAYVNASDRLKPEAAKLLDEALMRGQFERGEASRITGLPERSARRVLNDVIQEGLLASETPKTPVSLRFPAAALEALFPRLYPAARASGASQPGQA